jgi:hypothetical protein
MPQYARLELFRQVGKRWPWLANASALHSTGWTAAGKVLSIMDATSLTTASVLELQYFKWTAAARCHIGMTNGGHFQPTCWLITVGVLH